MVRDLHGKWGGGLFMVARDKPKRCGGYEVQ